MPSEAGVRGVVEAAARKGVELHVVTFAQSTRTAQQAADAVGAEVGQIVKSLVFVGSRAERLQAYLALVSGANTVDPERLAAALGEPRVRRATAEEARQLTGFAIGGIPPFGHAEPLQTVMDHDLGRFTVVWAAAGTANSVFAVPPATLRALANASIAPICHELPAGNPPMAARTGETVQPAGERAATLPAPPTR
ncbi:MAG: YbaK/EbsC family protein [Chloroflexota bacterium]|nr:YbaK/EbsC family protein [Chloroflexota bacterium]